MKNVLDYYDIPEEEKEKLKKGAETLEKRSFEGWGSCYELARYISIEEVAKHEAGHAIVGKILGLTPKKIELFKNSYHTTMGEEEGQQVGIAPGSPIMLDLWEGLTSTSENPEEILGIMEPSNGPKPYLKHALFLISGIAGQNIRGNFESPTNFEELGLSMWSCSNAGAISKRPFGYIFNNILLCAQRIIAKNKVAHSSIVDSLLKDQYLEEEELEIALSEAR